MGVGERMIATRLEVRHIGASKVKTEYVKAFAVALTAVGLFFAAYLFVADRREVFAVWTENDVAEVRVIGESPNRMEGWSVTLCWRRPGSPWMLYYLDHEGSYWEDVAIRREGTTILITEEGKLVGKLDITDGSFLHRFGRMPVRVPLAVSRDHEPSNRRSWIYEGSAEWESIWPAARVRL